MAELENKGLDGRMQGAKPMAKLDDKMEPKCKKAYVAPQLVVRGDIASLTEANNNKPNQNSILGNLVGGNPGNSSFSGNNSNFS